MIRNFVAVFRSLAAVLAGYFSIGILVMLTDFILGAISPANYLDGPVPPTYYFVASLVTAPMYSVVGGYVSAWLCRDRPWQHVLGLIAFGEVMGISSTALFWARQPHWYALSLLVLFPPAVWLGGWLRTRRARAKAAAAA